MLHWHRAFQTALGELDLDHLRLFTLFNHVEALGNLRREADLVELNRAVDMLLAYALEHFAREEHAMAQEGYPHRERHVASHEELREELIASLRGLVAGEIPAPTFLLLVRGPFLKHFMSEDYRFARWMRRRQPAPEQGGAG